MKGGAGVLILALLGAGCGPGEPEDQPAEPTQRGKTLSQWSAQLFESKACARADAANALGRMGSEPFPVLTISSKPKKTGAFAA